MKKCTRKLGRNWIARGRRSGDSVHLMETGITEGLEQLELVQPGEGLAISLHGSSLFSLYRVRVKGGDIAVKVMFDPKMARAEMQGLQELAEAGCNVPHCHGVYANDSHAFLYMEFIAAGAHGDPAGGLKENLTKLYARTFEAWGRPDDNFIGSLPQRNGTYGDFAEFWWTARIEPRFKQACDQGRLGKALGKTLEKMIRRLSADWGLNQIKPRLIHGDLWSGNVLCSASRVYLIDPSTARANPEQDLAMLDLFGSSLSLESMEQIARSAGLPDGFAQRIAFWQIYPLLVHVNLFGGSYARSVERAVETYT